MNKEIRLKKIDETRNDLTEEINRSGLQSKNLKKVCRVLNYIDHLFIVISTITACFSIFAFPSLIGVLIGMADSTIGLKICVINAEIKKV